MDKARQKIARAMSAAGEMRLALAGHVSFDVAARKWDDAAEDAHQAVCNLVAAETPDETTARLAVMEADRDKWFEGAGAHHVASMREAQRADRAEAALADANTSVVAFCAPAAVEYARGMGLPDGHLHPTHYDILEKAGARMDSFTRAAQEGEG